MKKIFGNVVEIDGVHKRVITIDGDKITQIERTEQAPPGVEQYDASCYIFPGFIDIHTHCREDQSGQDTHKEDYSTVGRAALSGGVICVADMPNNPVVPFNEVAYEAKRLISKRCPIDVLLYAAINQDSEPFGDRPYKCFMGPSTNHSGDLNFSSDSKLAVALKRYRGHSVSFHCENPVLLGAMSGQPTHEERRPPVAEFTAIDTACELIAEYGLRGKICHVSTQMGLETILSYRSTGANVTCEVTPHHLYFDTHMLTTENRRWLQMNPPIRPYQDRSFLLDAVRGGKIDFLATDHAPHTKDEKMRGMSGVPQLDTYGPFVAWLIKEQYVDPAVVFKMACKNPGEWVGQFWPTKKVGRILPDYEANLTVLDLNRTAIEGRPLYTKCGWSPFDLRRLPGMVTDVWLRGEKVVSGDYIKGF